MNRVRQLDVVRVAAALVVYVHHFFSGFFPTVIFGQAALQHSSWERWLYMTPLGLVANGNFAVHVFIVVSGFALYYSISAHPEVKISVSMYVQRYARLAVPVLASVLLGCWLGGLHNSLLPKVAESAPWLLHFWNVVPNWPRAIVQGAVTVLLVNDSMYNPVLWMMHYLWLSSVMLFTFLWLFPKLPQRRWVNVVLLVVFFKTAYLAFWLGVLLADLYTSHALPRLSKYARPLGWALVILFGSFPLYQGDLDVFYKYLILPGSTWGISGFYHGLAAALLLLLVLGNVPRASSRPSAWLTTASNTSFSLYLIHYVLLGSFTMWLFTVFYPGHSYGIASWLSFAATTLLLIPLSYIFYWLFDRITQRAVKRIHLKLPVFKSNHI